MYNATMMRLIYISVSLALIIFFIFSFGTINVFGASETDNSTHVSENEQICKVIQDVLIPTGVGFAREEYWSVTNLILTAISFLVFLYLIIDLVIKKKSEKKTNNMLFARIVSILPVISSYIVFIFTTNMSTPIIPFDMWTPIFALMCLLQLLLIFYVKSGKFDDMSD